MSEACVFVCLGYHFALVTMTMRVVSSVIFLGVRCRLSYPQNAFRLLLINVAECMCRILLYWPRVSHFRHATIIAFFVGEHDS